MNLEQAGLFAVSVTFWSCAHRPGRGLAWIWKNSPYVREELGLLEKRTTAVVLPM